MRWQEIPLKNSRVWGSYAMLREAALYDSTGRLRWVPMQHNEVLIALRERGAVGHASVFVRIPDAWVSDADFDLWAWVWPRANRARKRRIGDEAVVVPPISRRFPQKPPLAQPPP